MAKSKPAPSPAAKDKARPAQAAAPAPNVSDKFGVLLLALVAIMLIANVVVWGMAGAKRNGVSLFGTGAFLPTAAEYDAASQQARVMSYASTGFLGREAGDVDSAVINQGRRDGVRVGDVFVPSGLDPKFFVEFTVIKVGESSSVATIVTNMNLSQITDAQATGVLVNEVKPEATAITRNWAGQKVRSRVSPLAQ